MGCRTGRSAYRRALWAAAAAWTPASLFSTAVAHPVCHAVAHTLCHTVAPFPSPPHPHSACRGAPWAATIMWSPTSLPPLPETHLTLHPQTLFFFERP
eukprot:202438-Chlamydomonas_euryale.AAC.6